MQKSTLNNSTSFLIASSIIEAAKLNKNVKHSKISFNSAEIELKDVYCFKRTGNSGNSLNGPYSLNDSSYFYNTISEKIVFNEDFVENNTSIFYYEEPEHYLDTKKQSFYLKLNKEADAIDTLAFSFEKKIFSGSKQIFSQHNSQFTMVLNNIKPSYISSGEVVFDLIEGLKISGLQKLHLKSEEIYKDMESSGESFMEIDGLNIVKSSSECRLILRF